MSKTFGLWAVFAALSVLLLLSSLGFGIHSLYRSTLMIAMLSWCAWFASTTAIGKSRQQ